MRLSLSAIILFLAFMQVSADSFAQRITLNETNAPLEKVFQSIKEQTGYVFVYNSQDLKDTRVNIRISNSSVEATMKECLKGLPFTFKIIENNILVKKTEARQPAADLSNQQQQVRGRVTDSNGGGIPGVSVRLKGSETGTATDLDGNYELPIPEGGGILVFTSVGFATQEVSINGRQEINISMENDMQRLEEVIVIGYGTQKKSDLTGSVGSLKSEDFNQGVVATLQQLMQGKLAGVQVVQNDGKPGGGISVNIRGVGSINSGTAPLYVIDGLPSENIAFVSPSDIESIEVLKDASATAIYGARGANGVILITTKKGVQGKMKVNYDFYMGGQNVTRKLDVLNAEEYRTVLNEIIDSGGGSGSERVSELQNGGTNWQDEVYTADALVQSHNLSFSGGSALTRFYVGLNYFDQDGVVKNTSFQRYSARVNIEHDIQDKLKVGLNLSTSYIFDRNIPSGFGINESGGVLYAAYNYDPTIAAYDENGNYNRSPFMTMDNPLALLYGKNTGIHRYKTFGTISGEYFFIPELSFKLNIGGDINTHQRDAYVDKTTIEGLANSGVATFSRNNNSNYLIEGLLNYNKDFDKHSINAILGATTQRFITANLNGSGRGFPTDITTTYNLSSGDPLLYTLGSTKTSNQLLSYLGRLNYSALNKYLVTASFRIDGSSRFGENNRFGFFPSIAAAWKVNEENFFESASHVFSTLKARASWGRTGNQEIGNYEAVTTFGNGPVAVFDDAQIKTFQPTRIGNPALRWETTEQFNVGIDFGLLNERVYGSIDYFKKSTFDMLLNLPIPTSTGFNTQRQNIGRIENSGFEFSVTSYNLRNNKLSWTTNLNFSTLKNTVQDLGGIPQIISGSAGFANQVSIIREGLPLRSFYGYEIEGIWQESDDFTQTSDNVSPGDFKYRDIDGDGRVNADDRVVLGNSFPDFIWSVGNTFSFKNFELYVFFEGQQGLSMFNGNLAETYFPISFRRNRFADPLLKRWTPENPSSVYPSFINPSGQGQKSVNSYTVEDASYVRLNTVKLSYTLPSIRGFFNRATVYVTGQNLLTWTDYNGIDPAVNPNGGTNLRIDFNVYPLATTFLGGVILQF